MRDVHSFDDVSVSDTVRGKGSGPGKQGTAVPRTRMMGKLKQC